MVQLVDLPATREALGLNGPEKDSLLDSLIDRASDVVVGYLNRDIRNDSTLTFHADIWAAVSELRLPDWPIRSITEVKETDDGSIVTATQGTVLVEDIDYIQDNALGSLIRVTDGVPTTWATGLGAVRIQWQVGYASADAVPDIIRDVTLELIAMKYREVVDRNPNVQTQNDALGSFTRFGPPILTSGMKEQLNSERNVVIPGPIRWRDNA